jgi:glyoxylase-like metal-dependent hydrolase (beta-lactamase superfamily II)
MNNEDIGQYVCQVCGYNMVGYHPDFCPFCGAAKDKFLPAEENSARRHVEGTRINESVTRLNSVPKLGYEHAAYRVVADGAVFLIDCPSTFDRSLPQMDAIVFTHHHFLGASNQYRELYPTRVAIHAADSGHDLCRGFTFDDLFSGSFCDRGLHAVHLGGHTPGFTCYFFRDVLFICDYVMKEQGIMVINPFGPLDATRKGLARLIAMIPEHPVRIVCGVDYVMDYLSWEKQVLHLFR